MIWLDEDLAAGWKPIELDGNLPDLKYAPGQPRDELGRFGEGHGEHGDIQRETLYVNPKTRERGLALQQANMRATLKKFGITDAEVTANLDRQFADAEAKLNTPPGKPDAINSGMTWYRDAADQAATAITKMTGPDGQPYSREQAIAMVAATSPQNGWEKTLKGAEEGGSSARAGQTIYPNLEVATAAALAVSADPLYHLDEAGANRLANWDSKPDGTAFTPGDYRGSDLSAELLSHLVQNDGSGLQGLASNVEKAIEVARGGSIDENVNGDKVRNFYTNLVNPDHAGATTVDVWMGRVALGEKMIDSSAPKNKQDHNLLAFVSTTAGYEYVAQKIREGAAAHGILPQQYQAITWVQARYTSDVN